MLILTCDYKAEGPDTVRDEAFSNVVKKFGGKCSGSGYCFVGAVREVEAEFDALIEAKRHELASKLDALGFDNIGFRDTEPVIYRRLAAS